MSLRCTCAVIYQDASKKSYRRVLDHPSIPAELHIQTIGMDLKTKIVTHDDATTTKLQIWDTPGQDRYYKLARGSMTGTDAVLLVFSFDDRGSWR